MAVGEQAENGLKRQGLFYILVGASSALIELALFQGLYKLAGLPIEPSNVIAVVLATTYNFLMSRNVTFKSTSNPLRSLVLYLLLFAFNTTFSTLAIRFLVGAGWPSLIAKMLTMACIVLWNFVLYRKVVFR